MEEQPQSIVQATGRVAEKVVNGFSTSPALLLIVILNITMIAMVGYALISVAKLSAEGRTEITKLLETCIGQRSTL